MPLQLDRQSVCGRDKELQCLRRAFQSKIRGHNETRETETAGIGDTNKSKSAVLIEGESGTGKSVLVRQFLKDCQNLPELQNEGVVLVGEGKFEQQSSSSGSLLPFYAVTQAVAEIVDTLLHRLYEDVGDDEENFISVRQNWDTKLREAINSEASEQVLCTLVPRLGELLLSQAGDDDRDDLGDPDESMNVGIGRLSPPLGEDDISTQGPSATLQESEQVSLEMLKVAFRNLFRAISTEYTTIIFMDDLQWADKESLVLFMTMLEDDVLKQQPFLFVGAQRPLTGAIGEAEFARTRPELQAMCAEEIRLGNLDNEGVNSILMHLLKLEGEETLPLAKAIHTKTKGHPIFVIEFLRIAEQRGFLTMDQMRFKWVFDLEKVTTQMDLADNVADVLANKLDLLPEHKKLVLLVAAALDGFEFERDVLEEAMPAYLAYQGKDRARMTIDQDLTELENEGFVRSIGQGRYRFSHDKIREASQSHLPQQMNERQKLCLCLGRQLQHMLGASTQQRQQQSALLFQTVGLLNQARSLIRQPEEQKQLAKLNYEAAAMATERSSFFPASSFLEIAVFLLSPSLKEAWDKDYGTMLQFSNLQITVEFQCGRLETCREISDLVISNAKKFEEKKHAYFKKMLALMQKGDDKGAKKVAHEVLKVLGYPLPKIVTPFHIMKANAKLNKLLEDKTDDDLMNLPQLQDPDALTAMQFQERLAELCFTARKPDILRGVVLLHGPLTITVQKGSSPVTSMALLYFGMINNNMGLHDQAHRFGQLSQRYIKANPQSPRYDGRATMLYYWFIHHWRQSYQSSVEPLGKVLHNYWQKGILENYFIDAHIYVYIYFCGGLKLDALDADITRIAGQIRENNRLQALHNEAPFFQFVANMVDFSRSDAGFEGEYYDQKLGEEWERDGLVQPLMKMRLFRMIQCYYFQQYDEAYDLLVKLWPDDAMGLLALIEYQAFFRGMVTFAMAQQASGMKKWKLQRSGKAILKKVRSWVTNGNLNAHHLLQLLEAEYLVVKGAKPTKVKAAYDDAISSAARLGFLNNRALGNERAGMYCLQQGDQDWAATYFEAARESYADWGALAKVHHIATQYEDIAAAAKQKQGTATVTSRASSTNSRASRGMLGRSRLQDYSTEIHKSLCTSDANNVRIDLIRRSEIGYVQ